MNQGEGSPRLRRAYFECRHGQLHVHNAIPAGGGFDELTTLICLHASDTTGRSFLELSRLMGNSRSLYSPDIPGFGESDAPPVALSVAGYAEAIGDFLDSMRFRQIDLLGVRSGAAVAAEIAIARPKVVRRVVMVGAPADERLPLVKQPVLVLRPKDPFWDAGARVTKLVPGATVIDLADQDERLLENQAALAARHITPFLA